MGLLDEMNKVRYITTDEVIAMRKRIFGTDISSKKDKTVEITIIKEPTIYVTTSRYKI